MIDVDILAESGYKFDRRRVRSVIEKLLSGQGVTDRVEVSVSVVGERKIKALNKKYRQTDEITDVLSFPLEDTKTETPFLSSPDGVLRLGDIVICYSQAVRQAAEHNRMVDNEMEMLAEHGCRHLLGIHHA
jgi:probable rRNA maturation factor